MGSEYCEITSQRGAIKSRMRRREELCGSLIPGLDVKLSTIILGGPTGLSAAGVCPPHDAVR